MASKDAKDIEFQASCTKRDAEYHKSESERRRLLHDDILQRFNFHRDAYRQWDATCLTRHEEERSAFLGRREAERHFENQQLQSAIQREEEKRHREQTSTIGLLDHFEDNLRRLGLDEAQAAAAAGMPDAAGGGSKSGKGGVNRGEVVLTNEARILEIRKRKEDDIRARREKMQRQFRMQLEQERTGQDVLRRQQEEALLVEARAEGSKLRSISLQAQREHIEKEVAKSLAAAQVEAAKQRQMADFWEEDAKFALQTSAERLVSNEAGRKARQGKAAEEATRHERKVDDMAIWCSVVVRQVADLAVAVSDRNYIQIGETIIREARPVEFKTWRELVDSFVSQQVVQRAYDIKTKPPSTIATPRTRHRVNTTPPPPAAGPPPSAASPAAPAVIVVEAAAAPAEAALEDAGESLLSSLVRLDAAQYTNQIERAREQVQREAAARATAATTQKLLTATKSSSWHKQCPHMDEAFAATPVAAAFVFGDDLSGARLLGDKRFEQSSIVTPSMIEGRIAAAAAAAIAATSAAAAGAVSPATAAASPAPAATPAPPAKGAKKGTPSSRPPSANNPPMTPQGAGFAVGGVSNKIAQELASLIFQHHTANVDRVRRNMNAAMLKKFYSELLQSHDIVARRLAAQKDLKRKEFELVPTQAPLVLADFPSDPSFVLEVNAALSLFQSAEEIAYADKLSREEAAALQAAELAAQPTTGQQNTARNSPRGALPDGVTAPPPIVVPPLPPVVVATLLTCGVCSALDRLALRLHEQLPAAAGAGALTVRHALLNPPVPGDHWKPFPWHREMNHAQLRQRLHEQQQQFREWPRKWSSLKECDRKPHRAFIFAAALDTDEAVDLRSAMSPDDAQKAIVAGLHKLLGYVTSVATGPQKSLSLFQDECLVTPLPQPLSFALHCFESIGDCDKIVVQYNANARDIAGGGSDLAKSSLAGSPAAPGSPASSPVPVASSTLPPSGGQQQVQAALEQQQQVAAAQFLETHRDEVLEKLRLVRESLMEESRLLHRAANKCTKILLATAQQSTSSANKSDAALKPLPLIDGQDLPSSLSLSGSAGAAPPLSSPSTGTEHARNKPAGTTGGDMWRHCDDVHRANVGLLAQVVDESGEGIAQLAALGVMSGLELASIAVEAACVTSGVILNSGNKTASDAYPIDESLRSVVSSETAGGASAAKTEDDLTSWAVQSQSPSDVLLLFAEIREGRTDVVDGCRGIIRRFVDAARRTIEGNAAFTLIQKTTSAAKKVFLQETSKALVAAAQTIAESILCPIFSAAMDMFGARKLLSRGINQCEMALFQHMCNAVAAGNNACEAAPFAVPTSIEGLVRFGAGEGAVMETIQLRHTIAAFSRECSSAIGLRAMTEDEFVRAALAAQLPALYEAVAPPPDDRNSSFGEQVACAAAGNFFVPSYWCPISRGRILTEDAARLIFQRAVKNGCGTTSGAVAVVDATKFLLSIATSDYKPLDGSNVQLSPKVEPLLLYDLKCLVRAAAETAEDARGPVTVDQMVLTRSEWNSLPWPPYVSREGVQRVFDVLSTIGGTHRETFEPRQHLLTSSGSLVVPFPLLLQWCCLGKSAPDTLERLFSAASQLPLGRKKAAPSPAHVTASHVTLRPAELAVLLPESSNPFRSTDDVEILLALSSHRKAVADPSGSLTGGLVPQPPSPAVLVTIPLVTSSHFGQVLLQASSGLTAHATVSV